MAYKKPPKEHQFSSTKQPKKNGAKKGSIHLSTLIQKVLNKEIEIIDPVLKKKMKKKIIEEGLERQALRWLNGDNTAGRDLLDREFGKAQDNVNLSGNIDITVNRDYKKEDDDD